MTQPRAAARLRRPTREQGIAALLVGSVVILLGFASGLGLTSTTPTAAPAGGVALGPGSAAASSPETAASSAPARIAYVVPPAPAAAPAAPAAAVPGGAAAPTGVAAPTPTPHVPTSYSVPASPAPAPTPSPTPSPTPTQPSCPPDVVTTLVTTLLPSGNDSGSGDLLGLIDSILDPGPAATALLQLPETDLRARVADLLAQPDPAHPGLSASVPSSALLGRCTTDVTAVLHSLARGSDVTSAVKAATR